MESLNGIIIRKRKKDLYILYFFILSFIAFFAIIIFACIIFSMIFFFTYKRTIKILKNEIKDNYKMSGFTLREHMEDLRIKMAMGRVPELIKKIKKKKKKVDVSQ